jgi:hypothetical protein
VRMAGEADQAAGDGSICPLREKHLQLFVGGALERDEVFPPWRSARRDLVPGVHRTSVECEASRLGAAEVELDRLEISCRG